MTLVDYVYLSLLVVVARLGRWHRGVVTVRHGRHLQ